MKLLAQVGARALLSVSLYLPLAAVAQNVSDPVHPWVVMPPKLESSAYFSNLQQGEPVQSPFVVKFGLSHWGLAPAGQEIARTGHHYLLIDRPLPTPSVPAPLDRNHVDFSKGQMEAVLNLEPGTHTLRLLLTDHQRVPRFVYSKELQVVVLPGLSPLPEQHGRVPRLELLNLRDGQVLRPPFKLNFHASGLNISHQASGLSNTGYFRMRFRPVGVRHPQDVLISFPGGTTEAVFNPPEGTYDVQLLYVRNPGNVESSLTSEARRIFVKKQ
jgi:hypothetical protein